jgi:hypothetical protein
VKNINEITDGAITMLMEMMENIPVNLLNSIEDGNEITLL